MAVTPRFPDGVALVVAATAHRAPGISVDITTGLPTGDALKAHKMGTVYTHMGRIVCCLCAIEAQKLAHYRLRRHTRSTPSHSDQEVRP